MNKGVKKECLYVEENNRHDQRQDHTHTHIVKSDKIKYSSHNTRDRTEVLTQLLNFLA